MRGIDEIFLVAGLSWRNVWRNSRRSFLTFLTIVAGCTLIIFMRSFQNGGYSQMIEDSIAPLTSHIQIHENGFWKNMTLEYSFENSGEMIDRIRKLKGVTEAAPRISAGGLIIFRDGSAPGEIMAIDPVLEKKIITMHRFILPGGRYLEKGDTFSIIIGYNLADNLGVKTGDTVSLLSQGFDGSIAADNFVVRGIFRSPNISYNRALALIPFEQGVKTFSMNNYISTYAVRVDDIDQVSSISQKLKEIAGGGLEVLPWEELVPEVLQYIAMDKASTHLYVIILYIIVAFGVLNTIQMAVFERIREIGIMLSIGTSQGRIFSMILGESFIITVIGIFIGIIAGWGVSYYFTIYPMDFSAYQEEMELYNMSTLLFYAKIRYLDFVITGFFILAVSMLFTFFPARRAARLDPVRAIRHL